MLFSISSAETGFTGKKNCDIYSIIVQLGSWYGTEFITSLFQAGEDSCIFSGLIYVYVVAMGSRKAFFKLKKVRENAESAKSL